VPCEAGYTKGVGVDDVGAWDAAALFAIRNWWRSIWDGLVRIRKLRIRSIETFGGFSRHPHAMDINCREVSSNFLG